MQITLTNEHEDKLRALVADGAFESIDVAVTSAVALLLQHEENDDLLWAKPLLDEAVQQFERGEIVTHEQVMADIRAVLDEPR